MNIRLVNSTCNQARLADIRLLVVRDTSFPKPDENMDMIFTSGCGEIFGFKVEDKSGYGDSFVCCTTKAKLMEEMDACKFTTDKQKDKWLKDIRDAEKCVWQCWIDGEIYGVVVQKWNAEQRMWKCLDNSYQLYGWNDVKEAIKDFNRQYKIDAYCIDEEVGDVDDMLEEYVNIEL